MKHIVHKILNHTSYLTSNTNTKSPFSDHVLNVKTVSENNNKIMHRNRYAYLIMLLLFYVFVTFHSIDVITVLSDRVHLYLLIVFSQHYYLRLPIEYNTDLNLKFCSLNNN